MRVESGTSFFKKAEKKFGLYAVSGFLAAGLFSYVFRAIGFENSEWEILGFILIISLVIGGFVIGAMASKEHFDETFKCKKCETAIKAPLETHVSELPVLYHCSHCDILWYTGNTA